MRAVGAIVALILGPFLLKLLLERLTARALASNRIASPSLRIRTPWRFLLTARHLSFGWRSSPSRLHVDIASASLDVDLARAALKISLHAFLPRYALSVSPAASVSLSDVDASVALPSANDPVPRQSRADIERERRRLLFRIESALRGSERYGAPAKLASLVLSAVSVRVEHIVARIRSSAQWTTPVEVKTQLERLELASAKETSEKDNDDAAVHTRRKQGPPRHIFMCILNSCFKLHGLKVCLHPKDSPSETVVHRLSVTLGMTVGSSKGGQLSAHLSLHTSPLQVTATERCVDAVLCARRDLVEQSRYINYRKIRPQRTPLEEPDSWWRHAVRCITLELLRQSASGKRADYAVGMVSSMHQRKQYIAAYKRSRSLGWLAPRAKLTMRRLEAQLPLPELATCRWLAQQSNGRVIPSWLISKQAKERESSRRIATFHAAQRIARGLAPGLPNLPALTSTNVHLPLLLFSLSLAEEREEDLAFALRSIRCEASQCRENTGWLSFLQRQSQSRSDSCSVLIGAMELKRRQLSKITNRALDVGGFSLASTGDKNRLTSAPVGNNSHQESVVMASISGSPDAPIRPSINGSLAPLRLVVKRDDAHALQCLAASLSRKLRAIQPAQKSTLPDEIMRAQLQGRNQEDVKRLLAPPSTAAPASVLSLKATEISLICVLETDSEQVSAKTDDHRSLCRTCAVVRFRNCTFESGEARRDYEAGGALECFFEVPACHVSAPASKSVRLLNHVRMSASISNRYAATPDLQAVRKETNISVAASEVVLKINPSTAKAGMLLAKRLSELFELEGASMDSNATESAFDEHRRSSQLLEDNDGHQSAIPNQAVTNALNTNFMTERLAIEACRDMTKSIDSRCDVVELLLNTACIQASLTDLQNLVRFSIGSIEFNGIDGKGRTHCLLKPSGFNLSPDLNASQSRLSLLQSWRKSCLEELPRHLASRRSVDRLNFGGKKSYKVQQMVGRLVDTERSLDALVFISFIALQAEASILKEVAEIARELKDATYMHFNNEGMSESADEEADRRKFQSRKSVSLNANVHLCSIGLSIENLTFAHLVVSDFDAKLNAEGVQVSVNVIHLKDSLYNAVRYKSVVSDCAGRRQMLKLRRWSDADGKQHINLSLDDLRIILLLRVAKDLGDYLHLLTEAINGTKARGTSQTSSEQRDSDTKARRLSPPQICVDISRSEIHIPSHSWGQDEFLISFAQIQFLTPKYLKWVPDNEIYAAATSCEEAELVGALAQISNLSIEQVAIRKNRPSSRAVVIQAISPSVALLTVAGKQCVSTRISWLSGTFGERQLTLVLSILSENFAEKSTFGSQPIPVPNLPIGVLQPGQSQKPSKPAPRRLERASFELRLQVVEFFAFTDGTDHNIGEERGTRGPRLGSISLSWCKVHVHKDVDKAKAVWVRAHSIEMEDRRHESAPSINVIKCPMSAKASNGADFSQESHPVEVVFFRGGEDSEGRRGNRMLEVNLQGADLSWPYLNDLDFVYELEDAFTHGINVDFVDPHPRRARVPDHWMSVDVNLEGSQLFIPEIPSNVNGRKFARASDERKQGLKLCLEDFSLTYNKGGSIIKEVSIDARDLSAVAMKTARGKEPNRVSVADSLSAKLSLELWDTDRIRNIDFQAHLSPIVANLSFNGCSILRSTFQRLLEDEPERIENANVEQSSSVLKFTKEMNVSATIEDLEAKLIDDRNGDFLEIVRARCSEQSGTMRASYGPDDGVSTLSAALECCFEVEHLNSAIEEMQPILRPVELRLDHVQAQGRATLEVSLQDTLFTMITPSLMRTLGDVRYFADSLRSEYMKPKASKSKRSKTVAYGDPYATSRSLTGDDDQKSRSAAYKITNWSGLVVACTAPRDIKPLAFVKSGATKRLSVDKLNLQRVTLQDGSSISALVVSLQFEGDWMPVNDVIINNVGRYQYSLHSPFENLNIPVHVDVSLEGRVKNITLHSPLKLRNSTDRHIAGYVYMRNDSFSAARVSKVGRTHQTEWIEPNGELNLPVFAACSGLLYMKAHSFDFSDPDVIDLDRENLLNQQGICACPAMDGDKASFSMSVDVSAKTSWSPGRQNPLQEYVITFRPHFIIKNALPSGIALSVRDRETGTAWDRRIHEGRKLDLHGVDIKSRISLHVVSFDGMVSTEGALVHQPHPSSLRKLTERPQEDADGSDLLSELGGDVEQQHIVVKKRNDSEAIMDRLTIHVANEFHSECQQRHLTLYTPYWLINESCLQLCLKSKGALGPKLISRSSAPMPVAMQHGNLQLSLPTKRATWSRPITVSSIGLKGSVSIVVPKSEIDRLAHVNLSNKTLHQELADTEPAGVRSRGHGETANEYVRSRGEIETVQTNAQIELGLEVRMGTGPFDQTKLITAAPRFLLVNRCGFTVECKQAGNPNQYSYVLQDHEHSPFHWSDTRLPFLLTLRPRSEDCGWNFPPGMRLERSGYFGLRIRPTLRSCSSPLVIPVHSTISHSSYIVTLFSPSDDNPPYRIENKLPDVILSVSQKGANQDWEAILPNESLKYFWDDFEQPHKLRVQFCGIVQELKPDVMQKSKVTVDLSQAPTSSFVNEARARNALQQDQDQDRRSSRSVRSRLPQKRGQHLVKFVLSVSADGPTRVLTVATESHEHDEDDGAEKQLKQRLQELDDQLIPLNKSLHDVTAATGVDLSLYGVSGVNERQSLDTIESEGSHSGPSSYDSAYNADDMLDSIGSIPDPPSSGPKSASSIGAHLSGPKSGLYKHHASVDLSCDSFGESRQADAGRRRIEHSRSRSTAIVGTNGSQDILSAPLDEEEQGSQQLEEASLVDPNSNDSQAAILEQAEGKREIPGGNLSVSVGACTGLYKKADTYVEISVGETVRTTSLRRGTADPEWNEEIVFEKVSSQQEMSATVYGRGLLTSREFLGQVFINLAAIKRTSDDPLKGMTAYTLSRQNAKSSVHGVLRMEIVWRVTELDLMRMKIQAKEKELSMKEELLAACQMQQSAVTDDDNDHESVSLRSDGEKTSESESDDVSSFGFNDTTMDSASTRLVEKHAEEGEDFTRPPGGEAGNLSLNIVEGRNLLIPPDSIAALHEAKMYTVVHCGSTNPKITPAVQGSAAPQWNETLNIKAASLERTVFIQVFAKRRFGADTCLGTASFKIKDFKDGKPHYCALSLVNGDTLNKAQKTRKKRKKGKKKQQDASEENAMQVIGQLCVRIRWQAVTQQFNALDDFKSLLKVKIHSIGVSLVEEGEDSRRREIAHLHIGDVKVEGRRKASESFLHVTVGSIQLDNQVLSSSLPVVVARTPRLLSEIKDKQRRSEALAERGEEDEGENDERPQLEFSFKLQAHGKNITYVKYCDLLVQKLDIELEEDFVDNMVNFVSTLPFNDLKGRADETVLKKRNDVTSSASPVQDVLASRMRPHRKSGDRLYFEFFRVQPMELCVTLRVNTHSRSGDRGSAAKSVYRYTRAAGFPILNLERASMQLISFELYDEFVSRDDFMLKLSFFYAAQAVFQLCKVGGGIEGLQPAASIVYGIGSGVRSFFYEPARGVVDAPDQLGKRVGGALGGVVKGTQELFKKSFRGAFDTLSNLADTASRGLAYISMDQSYAYSLHSSRLRVNEATAQDFFLEGVTKLGRGVYEGLSGFILDPIRQARKFGPSGFFRGCLSGFVGVPAKTGAGVLQFTSKSIAGIKTLAMGEHQLAPKRRWKSPEMIQYTTSSVTGAEDITWWQRWLETASRGQFAAQRVKDVIKSKRNRVAIFTSERLLYCYIKAKRVKWSVEYASIIDVYGSERFLQVALRERKYVVLCGQRGSAGGVSYSQRRAMTCATREMYDSILGMLYHAQQITSFRDEAAESHIAQNGSSGNPDEVPYSREQAKPETQERYATADQVDEGASRADEAKEGHGGRARGYTDIENQIASIITLCLMASKMQAATKAYELLHHALMLLQQLRLACSTVNNKRADRLLEQMISQLVFSHESEPLACACKVSAHASELQSELCLLTQPLL